MRKTYFISVLTAVVIAVAISARLNNTANADIVQPDNTIQPIAVVASGAAQSNAAALPTAAGKVTYITGFDLTGGGATAASVIEVTVTGLSTNAGTTLKFEVAIAAGVTAPAFSTTGPYTYSIRFPVPLPASALNSAITVTAPSYGAGNTNASVLAYGFLK
jgi:hypothetical protein